MSTWIALFRGINVGGNNLLPMQQLITLLERNGCSHVRTYIQSGNVVFNKADIQRAALRELIESAVSNEFGFAITVHLLTARDFRTAVQANPFTDAEGEPKSLHLFFLAQEPTADLDALNEIKAKTEHFEIRSNTFYLHAPDGIGRSKLAAKAEKLLGTSATARNWRTVSKVLQMLEQPDG